MITNKEMLDMTANMRKHSPEYDAICSYNRPEEKRRVFIIDENVYFEYWDVHEFEFTFYGNIQGEEMEDYYALAFFMTLYASQIQLSPKQLPAFIAICKERAAAIHKRYAA